MARINLLPWREELRKERQKQFYVVAGGSAAVMLGVIVLVHIHISGMIDSQNSRNKFLENEIKAVEKKIAEIEDLEKQKAQLIARMRVIERLQRNRPEIVHLFEEIAKATPEGLYLTEITQKGTVLTISGQAQSNARVSSFMRNLDASAWLENPVLDVIQSASGKGRNSANKVRTFTLRIKQSSSK